MFKMVSSLADQSHGVFFQHSLEAKYYNLETIIKIRSPLMTTLMFIFKMFSLGLAVALLTCIREALGSNFNLRSVYSDIPRYVV
jgi:hypothetical protein